MTAKVQFEANRAQVLRKLEMIKAIVMAESGGNVHWGHVGSMAHVNELLNDVGHHAGVPELTEH